MSKNIEININTSTNSTPVYESLYPITLSSQIKNSDTILSSFGLSQNSIIDEAFSDLKTTQNTLSSDLSELKDSIVSKEGLIYELGYRTGTGTNTASDNRYYLNKTFTNIFFIRVFGVGWMCYDYPEYIVNGTKAILKSSVNDIKGWINPYNIGSTEINLTRIQITQTNNSYTNKLTVGKATSGTYRNKYYIQISASSITAETDEPGLFYYNSANEVYAYLIIGV